MQVTKDKDAAVRGQDFEKAGQLRDREMELKSKISAIIAGAKEQGKAEAESVEGGGPTVSVGCDMGVCLLSAVHQYKPEPMQYQLSGQFMVSVWSRKVLDQRWSASVGVLCMAGSLDAVLLSE